MKKHEFNDDLSVQALNKFREGVNKMDISDKISLKTLRMKSA